MGATCGAENTYPSGALEFTPDFSGVHVAQSFVFCVVFCISLFVLFLLTMELLKCLWEQENQKVLNRIVNIV
jgi:hypothetical protein